MWVAKRCVGWNYISLPNDFIYNKCHAQWSERLWLITNECTHITFNSYINSCHWLGYEDRTSVSQCLTRWICFTKRKITFAFYHFSTLRLQICLKQAPIYLIYFILIGNTPREIYILNEMTSSNRNFFPRYWTGRLNRASITLPWWILCVSVCWGNV